MNTPQSYSYKWILARKNRGYTVAMVCSDAE